MLLSAIVEVIGKRRMRRWASLWSELRAHPTVLIGGLLVATYLAVALLAPLLVPPEAGTPRLALRLQPPAWLGGQGGLLGTDALGRDLFWRVLLGTRVSIAVGLISVAISIAVGAALGAVAGMLRGAVDALLSRLADMLMAFPYLIFTFGAMVVLGPGFTNLILALAFKGWVEFFRLVRSEVMNEQTRDYVEAARALGLPRWRIAIGEIFPNIVHSLLVLGTLRVGYFIITEASLSYLGLGIPPEIPAWGSMVTAGRNYVQTAWWVSTMPGLAIVGLVLGINLLGEGLRDLLDPRLNTNVGG